MRAHLYKAITESHGEVQYGTAVRILQPDVAPDSASPISDTVWAAKTGDVEAGTTFTITTGVIDVWLDTPQYVMLGLTPPNQGEYFIDNVAVLAPGTSASIVSNDGSPVVITGPPSSGKIIVADTGTTAHWATPSSGGGPLGLNDLYSSGLTTSGDGSAPDDWTWGTPVDSTGLGGPVFVTLVSDHPTLATVGWYELQFWWNILFTAAESPAVVTFSISVGDDGASNSEWWSPVLEMPPGSAGKKSAVGKQDLGPFYSDGTARFNPTVRFQGGTLPAGGLGGWSFFGLTVVRLA